MVRHILISVWVSINLLTGILFIGQDCLAQCVEPPPALVVVNSGDIVIDGNYDDWQLNHRVYVDQDGADCDNVPGRDIQEVYLAQDDDFIYLRFVLNGSFDETFGYKFGTGPLHVSLTIWEGQLIAYYGNNYGGPQPDLPQDYFHVTGNQYEVKFEKANVVAWQDEEVAAWCDQGVETVCRDYVDIGILTSVF